nr:hypothetical protein [Tanacetum cinerariifolium]
AGPRGQPQGVHGAARRPGNALADREIAGIENANFKAARRRPISNQLQLVKRIGGGATSIGCVRRDVAYEHHWWARKPTSNPYRAFN